MAQFSMRRLCGVIALSTAVTPLFLAGAAAAAASSEKFKVVDTFTLPDGSKAETVELPDFKCFQPNTQFGQIDDSDRKLVNGEWGNHEFVLALPAKYSGGPVSVFMNLTGGGFAWVDTSFEPSEIPAEMKGLAWGKTKGEGRHAGPEARLLSTQWWNRKHAYSVLTYSPLEELPGHQGKPTSFTSRFRERFPDWALVYPSYCSRDAYHGTGEPGLDGRRYGYLALVEALRYVDEKHGIKHLFVGGVSAGGLGSAVIAAKLRNDMPDVELLGAIVDSGPAEGRAYGKLKDDGVVDGLRRIVVDDQGTQAWIDCDDPLQNVGRGIEAIGFDGFSLTKAIEQGKVTVPIFHAWNSRDVVTLCGDLSYSQKFMDGAIARAITAHNPGGASVNYEKCEGKTRACAADEPMPADKCPADKVVEVPCTGHGVIGRANYAEDVFRWMENLVAKAGTATGGSGRTR